MEKKKILIIAGEPSGDLHAGKLVNRIKKISNDFEFFGLGGDHLKAEGVKIYFDLKDLAVMGFWEVLRKLPQIKKIFDFILDLVDREKSKFAILVDYPGFNLRLAKELKKRGVTIIYYISPQVWAWQTNRINILKKVVDLMIVFFKFEEELYKKEKITVKYFGHPLIEIVKPRLSKDEFYQRFAIPKTKYTISLLAGSRQQEVEKILPVMLKTAYYIYKDLKDIKFLILRAPSVKTSVFERLLEKYDMPLYIINNSTYDGLSISDFAMVASGTATLETAILEIPMVIIYKLSFLNWLYLRPLIKVPYIGMVNLIAKKIIVPEFIQFNAQPTKIASYIKNVLNNHNLTNKIKEELKKIKLNLGNPPVIEKIAQCVIEFIKNR